MPFGDHLHPPLEFPCSGNCAFPWSQALSEGQKKPQLLIQPASDLRAHKQPVTKQDWYKTSPLQHIPVSALRPRWPSGPETPHHPTTQHQPAPNAYLASTSHIWQGNTAPTADAFVFPLQAGLLLSFLCQNTFLVANVFSSQCSHSPASWGVKIILPLERFQAQIFPEQCYIQFSVQVSSDITIKKQRDCISKPFPSLILAAAVKLRSKSYACFGIAKTEVSAHKSC